MNERDFGIVSRDETVELTPELEAFTAAYSNVSIVGMKRIEALRCLLVHLRSERSRGDGCVHATQHDEPLCACAFQLALLLDMPGETLLDPDRFRYAMTILSNHSDAEIAGRAYEILQRLESESPS